MPVVYHRVVGYNVSYEAYSSKGVSMSNPLQVRVFLSSPSDVSSERALALQVLERLPYEPALRGRIQVEAIAWDKPGSSTPLLATMTPQEAINDGLPRPSECDIVIVLFWSRLGTPLPASYTKPDGSRYLSGTEWEYEDAMQAAKASGKPAVVVYRRTEDVVLKPSDPDFMPKYEQWQRVQEFFASFIDEDGTIRQGYNSYRTPDEFRQQFEQHIKTLVERLLEDNPVTSDTTTAPPILWEGSPFPGLRAFTAKDAPIFFGRGRETDALLKHIEQSGSRCTFVVGASGSGKSSLVGAGLLPQLSSGAIEGSADWTIVRFTPGDGGDNPFTALLNAMKQTFPNIDTEKWLKQLTDDPTAINTLCEEYLAGQPIWAEVMLFIDQFEELFTLANPTYQATFATMLASLDDRIRAICTLRADFYARCVEIPTLAELLRNGSFPLAAPGIGSLHDMVVRPAALAGLQFEEGLPQRLLDDTGSDPGALALLAYTLDELYRACKDSGLLTCDAYDRLGGVQGAIGQRAEHTFATLDADTQATLPEVFRELVAVDEDGTATRQRTSLERVGNNAAHKRLVTALTDARLLVQTDEHGKPVVEVAHEALLRSWTRLASWIESARDDLHLLRQVKLATQLWMQHNRSDDFLWSGDRLKAAISMIERLQPTLTESEQAFIVPEHKRLMEEIAQPATPHYRRALIGERLNELGDARPGVGLREDGLPDFVWCDVSGGVVTLEASKSSGGNLTFNVKPFRIAKYLITYSQYQAFIKATDGYTNPQWWDGIGKHQEPPSQSRPFANHPAEYVSWYDAVAFCRWASEKLSTRIRLPTEWEWQMAASGGNTTQRYVWGADWDERAVNTRESTLLRTTAVGMYPQSAVSNGAMDMTGNIWEWCVNELQTPQNVALGGTRKRALRGCSCLSRKHKAYFAYRAGNIPSRRSEAHGFRVCMPLSDTE